MPLAELSLASQIAYALQLVLGVMFLVSASSKLRRPRLFQRIVTNYRLLPREASPFIAGLVIAAEAFLAAALLSGELVEPAVALAAVVLTAFSAAIAVNIRRGRAIPCGCFGAAETPISWRSLARNAFILVALIVLAALRPAGTGWRAVTSGGPSSVEAFISVLALALGLVLAATWLLSLPELKAIVDPQRRLAVEPSISRVAA
jgi:hypothetical protein